MPTSDGSDSRVISKVLSDKVCNCLFEKNKDFSINELEAKVFKKLDTPGSDCIRILDDHFVEG